MTVCGRQKFKGNGRTFLTERRHLCKTFFQETVGRGSPSATQGITTDWPG